jgi:hypothetical protein
VVPIVLRGFAVGNLIYISEIVKTLVFDLVLMMSSLIVLLELVVVRPAFMTDVSLF